MLIRVLFLRESVSKKGWGKVWRREIKTSGKLNCFSGCTVYASKIARKCRKAFRIITPSSSNKGEHRRNYEATLSKVGILIGWVDMFDCVESNPGIVLMTRRSISVSES